MIATLLRSALLGLALAACATTPPAPRATAALDRHGESCALDTDCPGGSCRSGTCSWTAPDLPAQACTFDEQCFAGSGTCRAGRCLPGPPDRTFLASPRSQ